MATDFAIYLRRFLTTHLTGLRGCSPNTIGSYRDTFKLLITYLRDDRSIRPEKLTLDRLDAAAITGFLEWLQASRRNSASTRNQRLAAISSFCTWMQTEDPARMACYQNILAIPAKKQPRPGVNHLTVEQTRLLLAQPDRSTRRGRRDATLLATLYDTAARVQELADLTVRDIRLEHPAMACTVPKPAFRVVWISGSGSSLILVDDAAEDASSSDRHIERDDDRGVVLGRMLVQALMRPMSVEVVDILVENPAGVALVVDQHPVGALLANCAYKPFDVTVRPRRPRRNPDHLDALVSEDGVERAGVLAIAVADQEPEAVDTSAQVHNQVADLLRGPFPGRVFGDAEQVHPP